MKILNYNEKKMNMYKYVHAAQIHDCQLSFCKSLLSC